MKPCKKGKFIGSLAIVDGEESIGLGRKRTNRRKYNI